MKSTATQTKYYTPNLSEFHVGFEYEENILLSEGGTKWMKNKLEIEECENFFKDHEYLDLKNHLRVKHLDREDIESLGFEVDSNSRDFWIYHLKSDPKYNTSLAFAIDGYVEVFKITPNKTLFKGKIKNKSELKRILTQIGVIK